MPFGHAIFNGMYWLLYVVALALFVTWIVFRVVLGIPLGVLNLLWMYAVVLVILGAAQGVA